VVRLEALRAEHAEALLAFERDNRAYFAAVIPDRGDDFFTHFGERLDEALAQQATGRCRFHVLVADDGAVIGRFNLFDIDDGTAVLGYRMAERRAGQGLATAAVLELCRSAAETYGLVKLRAATTNDNVGSQRVLTKAGFVPVGPTVLNDKPATWHERLLSAPRADTV
jgi:ribosomal-protein-alanine N-acetyltransferase